MTPQIDVLKALARLEVNSDFQTVLEWLRAEREAVVELLTSSIQPVLVHQAQGRLSCLTDITRSAMTANAALAAHQR